MQRLQRPFILTSYTRRLVLPIGQIRCTTTSASLDGPAISDTNRAEVTHRRFWTMVGIGKHPDGLTVNLDNRPLKTPSGNTLVLPEDKSMVAALIAAEWESQESLLKSHALPVTSIASRAIDAMSKKAMRHEVCSSLLTYVDTDTICFHHNYPPDLVELQTKHWDPLLQWARTTFNIDIKTFESILFHSQPPRTKQRIGEVLARFNRWELAAMERATHTTKSIIIALALVTRHLTVEEASSAAQVEVRSQIQRWGEVEDSHDVDFHDIRRQLGSAASLLLTP